MYLFIKPFIHLFNRLPIVCLFIHPSIYAFIHLPTACLFYPCTCLLTYRSTHQFIYIFIKQSVNLFNHPSINSFIYLSTSLSVCLSLCHNRCCVHLSTWDTFADLAKGNGFIYSVYLQTKGKSAEAEALLKIIVNTEVTQSWVTLMKTKQETRRHEVNKTHSEPHVMRQRVRVKVNNSKVSREDGITKVRMLRTSLLCEHEFRSMPLGWCTCTVKA